MKVNKIDHICIAVKDLDAARKIWEPILGKPKPDDPYVDEPEKIRVARYWLGDVGFELMESTSPDGDVAKFIEKRGEGIMLIGLNVDNTREAMEELKRLEKDKEISQDEDKRAQEQLQKLTDKFVTIAEQVGHNKEQELMEI